MSPRIKKPEEVTHRCRECAHCEPLTEFHTLSIEGKATLGRCQYYTEGKYCVLLTQKSCNKFKEKSNFN